MNNNYYIPDIEDIRVGYECEMEDNIKGYFPYIFNEKGVRDVMQDVILDYQEAFYRTPYLTKEQIEAEGWKEIPRELNGFGKYSYFQKGDKHITFQEENNYIEIHNDEGYSEHQTWYEGECKSINEFRTICKLLNIT